MSRSKTYSANEALHILAEKQLRPRSGAQKEIADRIGLQQNTLSGLVSDKRGKNAGTQALFRVLLGAKASGCLDEVLENSKNFNIK